jgi:type II secretory pathway component PulM
MSTDGRPTTENRTQQATLGCGTLILIALIVMIFSRADTKDLEREVKELKTEVGALKKTIETQTGEIKALREKVGK